MMCSFKMFEIILLKNVIDLLFQSCFYLLKVSLIKCVDSINFLENQLPIKSIKMKASQKTTPNPQKQQHINIFGYLNGPKLFKRQNQINSSTKKQRRAKRISPISIKHNYGDDGYENNSKNIISGRNTFRSQKFPIPQENNVKGFYTSRNNEKQAEMRVSFEVERQFSSKVNTIKNQFNSEPRNRFYYKKEYDTTQTYQDQSQLLKKQSQRIIPGYFNKINSRFERNHQHKRQSRSKSPLEESHQQLFAKCYKETSNHLQLMLKQIHQSQENIHLVHKQIMDIVYSELKQRTERLREKMINLVEGILDEWQSSQWSFLQNNEILFLDDLLQLKEQLNQRQDKIHSLIMKLQEERKYNWSEIRSSLDNIKTQTVWKNVTTDLLMFNYENSIIQIQQLIEKVSSNVPHKCQKAIEMLSSSSLNHSPNSINQTEKPLFIPTNDSQAFMQLKRCITIFLEQTIKSEKCQQTNKERSNVDAYQNRENQQLSFSSYRFRENP